MSEIAVYIRRTVREGVRLAMYDENTTKQKKQYITYKTCASEGGIPDKSGHGAGGWR
jgi:hypothetical protein